MKKLSSSLSLLALAGLAACMDQSDTPLSSIGTTQASFDEAPATAGSWIVSLNGGSKNLAAKVAELGGTVEWTHEGAGIAVVSGLGDAAAEQLRGLQGVAEVNADGVVSIDPVSEAELSEAMGTDVAAAEQASQANPATSFFFPRQWNHRAVGADKAWAAGFTGSADVTVAILDSGVDGNYVDLKGLVDLSRSVSFVASDDQLVAQYFPSAHPSTDLQIHGTHVASIVSSKASAVAGVTSRTTLMSVKVLGVSGSGATSGVLKGVLYAADNGADVINMSLGSGFTKAGNGRFLAQVHRVMQYANRAGAVVVVAAGNDNADLDHNGNFQKLYCGEPGVICVAATGPTGSASVNGPFVNVDARAGYSNYGRSAISVAAPGGSQRPVWGACSTTSLTQTICQTGTFTVGVNGTSQATPHVSGLAALLVAKIGKDKPAQIRAAIQQSADDLGETGTDPFYGKGRINVARAMGL